MSHAFTISLWLSLLAFIFRGIEYALIASYVPILFALSITMILVILYYLSGLAFSIALKIWASILILYSIIRISFWVFFQIDPMMSAHGADSFSNLHLFFSVLYFLTGIIIMTSKWRRIDGIRN